VTRRPTVDVLIDGKRLCTIHFRLAVRFVLEANAAVESGELVEISAGNALITATFLVEVPTRGDAEVLSRRQPIPVLPIIRPRVGVSMLPAAPPIPEEPSPGPQALHVLVQEGSRESRACAGLTPAAKSHAHPKHMGVLPSWLHRSA
jgi:hypothetical protein